MSKFSRREILRAAGVGASLMPLLNADLALAAGAAKPFPKRLICIAWPNGVMADDYWPTGGETNFTISTGAQSILKPLIPHQKDILVMGGLEMRTLLLDGGEGHAAFPHILTGARAMPVDQEINADGIKLSAGGISVDQFVANKIAATDKRPFHSLPLNLFNIQNRSAGRFLSFSGPVVNRMPNAPTPEYDSERLFRTLFGDSMPSDDLDKIRRERKSVLDVVGKSLARSRRRLGAEDRQRLDAHVEGVRSIETQLDGTGSLCATPTAPPSLDYSNARANPDMPAIIKSQVDLVVAAMACDLTRVSSSTWATFNNNEVTFFWLGNEFTNSSNPDNNAGCNSSCNPYTQHHEIAHNADGDARYKRMKSLVDQWFHSQLAYLLSELKKRPEGDGTMLDNTLVLFANCQYFGGNHTPRDLPWILAGNAAGYFKQGRFLRNLGGGGGNHAPTNGVLAAICNAMGYPVDHFGEPSYGGELPKLRG